MIWISLETSSQQVANQSKSDGSWDHYSRGLDVRDWVRRSENIATFIFLLSHFRGVVVLGSWLDWSLWGRPSATDHFLQFTFLTGGSVKRRSFMQLICLVCEWVLLNEHNNRLFRNKEINMCSLLEKVKIHSYWWMKAANVVFVLGGHSWLVCPLICLGIG